jgi:hypothetical protein
VGVTTRNKCKDGKPPVPHMQPRGGSGGAGRSAQNKQHVRSTAHHWVDRRFT